MPNSSRLTQGDLDATVNAMAASLAASDFLAGRNATSSPIVIVTNRVQNLTDDIIPVAEQWMLIARVQTTLPIRVMGDQKNIRFVIPPERYEQLLAHGFSEDASKGLEPTHVMAATFLSARRAGAKNKNGLTDSRLNYYYLEYSIFDLSGREILWSDAFEFKRSAFGKVID